MTGQKHSEPADGALGRQDRSVHAAKTLPKGPETVSLRDEKEALWNEAVTKARQAIYDADGRGMVGRSRNYLADRVARAILAERREILSLLPPKGWRLVPESPTTAMKLAPRYVIADIAHDVWNLMLKAAPNHPGFPDSSTAAPVTKTVGVGNG